MADVHHGGILEVPTSQLLTISSGDKTLNCTRVTGRILAFETSKYWSMIAKPPGRPDHLQKRKTQDEGQVKSAVFGPSLLACG